MQYKLLSRIFFQKLIISCGIEVIFTFGIAFKQKLNSPQLIKFSLFSIDYRQIDVVIDMKNFEFNRISVVFRI